MAKDLEAFQQLLSRTVHVRERLQGCHPPLERGIDSATNGGQIRLASGELATVNLFELLGLRSFEGLETM